MVSRIKLGPDLSPCLICWLAEKAQAPAQILVVLFFTLPKHRLLLSAQLLVGI